jgi:hypothetical protein
MDMKTFITTEVEAKIILLKELKKEAGFTQQNELASLQCWLYNRHRGPYAMELYIEAFLESGDIL